jgi:hypothetical protein
MTSARTCVVKHQLDYYVSDRMIEVALKAGARCLEFDIYAKGFSIDPIPIVTTGLDKSNFNTQHNYVPLETCFQRISRSYFENAPQYQLQDPLFLHLTIHRSVNTNCMNRIATLVQKYFHENSESRLLSGEFNYTKKKLAMAAICQLYGKVIIMVRIAPGSKCLTGPLKELTNVLSNHNGCRDKDWNEVKNTVSKSDLINFNRKNITYVRPSYFPYTPLTTEYDEGGTKSDSLLNLLVNKQTINNDATPALQLGCQFVAMNFQNIDEDLLSYLGLFKNSSFILKPEGMRRKETPLTAAGTSCDLSGTSNEFQGDTFCSATNTDDVTKEATDQLNRSRNTIIQSAKARKKSAFPD